MKPVFLLLLAALPAAIAGERVLTTSAAGHLIHNSQVISHDGRFIVFDARNDETQLAGSDRIGMVEIASGLETTLYQVANPGPWGPGVGAATFSPRADEVAFIHGLDTASAAMPYAAQRRSGAIVRLDAPGEMTRLDARDVTAPFTPGALRGGTHAHHWSPDGSRLSFTYNDAVVPAPGPAPADLRTVGVIIRGARVEVAGAVPGEEFSGDFTTAVVPVTADPESGGLSRADGEGWVGNDALAFIGTVAARGGGVVTEVFIADLPSDLKREGDQSLAGTATTLPAPPAGLIIRRLTFTEDSRRPGLQGPRHWVRASPDGSTIAFLDEDENGIVQINGVPRAGGEIRVLSDLPVSVETPFNWSPDSRQLACSAGGRIALIDVASGNFRFLTPPSQPRRQPLHGAVFSPDGKSLAFNRLLSHSDGGEFLQICLIDVLDGAW